MRCLASLDAIGQTLRGAGGGVDERCADEASYRPLVLAVMLALLCGTVINAQTNPVIHVGLAPFEARPARTTPRTSDSSAAGLDVDIQPFNGGLRSCRRSPARRCRSAAARFRWLKHARARDQDRPHRSGLHLRL